MEVRVALVVFFFAHFSFPSSVVPPIIDIHSLAPAATGLFEAAVARDSHPTYSYKLINSFCGAESFLNTQQSLILSRNLPSFMEPQGSESSQEPTVGSCIKPNESCSHRHNPFL
jgi:hypothetical protein